MVRSRMKFDPEPNAKLPTLVNSLGDSDFAQKVVVHCHHPVRTDKLLTPLSSTMIMKSTANLVDDGKESR